MTYLIKSQAKKPRWVGAGEEHPQEGTVTVDSSNSKAGLPHCSPAPAGQWKHHIGAVMEDFITILLFQE